MSRRNAVLAQLLVACAILSSCTMWENPPKGWAGATGGEQLERQLWKEIAAQNWSELRKRLAATFTLTAPTGSLGPEEAIEYWRARPLKEYALGEFNVKPNGADVAVSYTMNRSTTAQGQTALRLMSVWQELGGEWVLIAHSVVPFTPEPGVAGSLR